MRIFEKTMALLLVCGLLSANACAQEEASAPAPAALQENAEVPSTDQAKAQETRDNNVSLDFRDADIANVLKILSYKSGVNIVVGPEVTGLVTIQLNDVPWKQALEVILETYGYAYEQKGNIITVTTVENLKQRRENAIVLAEQEPVETRTFTLNFGRASEIIASIEKMRSERGSINFDERTNTLIITDIAKRLDLMEGVIQKLDRTTPQVLIEAKILETGFDDKDNLGIDWVTKVTLGGAERPTTFPFTSSSSNKYARDSFVGTETTKGSANTEFTYGTLNFTQLQVVFEMLKQKTDTNILSNPRIVTLDNQAAQIMVGTQYPIPQYTYNEQQATLQVSGWEYKDIGIIFDVTPHVNNAGFVTLDVQPKITAIVGTVVVENTSLPQLSNESTKTRVMIKDGETLVIAGLVKSQLSDTKKKVPLLGDVPVLGLIFQKSEKTNAKTDLMIFITPHVITPEMPAAGT
ncbi:MAG: type IV pilus secretin PilQ [Candidatus Omnitrophica bacterium]|nr:type IV pilus secretin PilQ [Candidatus Omnitrophota bacterium]